MTDSERYRLRAEVELYRLHAEVESWQDKFCAVVKAKQTIVDECDRLRRERDGLMAAARGWFTAIGSSPNNCDCPTCVAENAMHAAVARCEE